ncbi:MAG: histidine phosphatase family protein [Balneolaceae bacterium]
MKQLIPSLLAIFLITGTELVYSQQVNTTTYLIVRHAERADDGGESVEDPYLSTEGLHRAVNLVKALQAQPVDAVFSTDVNRTRMTVALVAAANGVHVEYYDWKEQNAFLEQISETHRGKTILIAGHSNTVDTATNTLLGYNYFTEKLRHDDYDNLLIITSSTFGSGTLIHLKY